LSVCVQGFWSLHEPPVFGGFEHVPFVGLHVPARWHTSWASHTTASLPTQSPCALHLSVFVHAFWSSHVAPGFGGFEHIPVVVLQVPATWHSSSAVHTTASLPTQLPCALHLSVFVHALPSLQVAPGFGGFVHIPVAESHVPAVWHASCAVQVTGLLPTHMPCALHVSVFVHALLSLHPVPVSAVCTQPEAGLQLSAVQGLPSSHEMGSA
jgi:hypothetical protein